MAHHHHKDDHRHHHCEPDKWAVIRNQRSGLVLDASEHQLKLQHFTGFDSQLWRLEEAEPGKYYIINKGNGHVMDIEGGAKCGHKIITFPKNGGENQQWHINSDDTIVSAVDNLAVDIRLNLFNFINYNAGSEINAYRKHGMPNQIFELQYQ